MITEAPLEVEELEDGWQWLRKAQAAAHLGVSEKTVENRINAGKLRKRVQAGVVEILCPPRDVETEATRALALVERYNEALAKQTLPLVSQIRELSETNGRLAAENEALRKELSESQAVSSQRRSWWSRIFS